MILSQVQAFIRYKRNIELPLIGPLDYTFRGKDLAHLTTH